MLPWFTGHNQDTTNIITARNPQYFNKHNTTNIISCFYLQIYYAQNNIMSTTPVSSTFEKVSKASRDRRYAFYQQPSDGLTPWRNDEGIWLGLEQFRDKTATMAAVPSLPRASAQRYRRQEVVQLLSSRQRAPNMQIRHLQDRRIRHTRNQTRIL